MGIADFGAGVQGALEKMMADRIAQEHYADAMRQQQFNNNRLTANDHLQQQLRQDTLAENRRNHDIADQDKRIGLANTLGDQIPENTFLPPTDPGVGILRTGGRGSLLKEQQERPEVLTGPLMPGDTGAAKQQGFIKTASAKQLDTNADNARQAAQAAEAQRHNRATEEKPPKDPTPHYTFMQGYDADSKPNGVLRGSTLTGQISPVDTGNKNIKPGAGSKPLPYQAVENISGLNSAEVEAVKVLKALRESGLDQSNDPADPRWNKFLVASLGIAPGDVQKADIQQRTAMVNARLTRALMGGRPSQFVAEMIQQHLPKGEQTGQQLAHVLHNVMQQTGEQRQEIAKLTGKQLQELLPTSGQHYAAYLASLAGGGEQGGGMQEGQEGNVGGVPAVWKTVNGKSGWYAK